MSKRLRMVLAPVVTILLLLQSVAPGAMAEIGSLDSTLSENVVATDNVDPKASDQEGTETEGEATDEAPSEIEPGTGEADQGDNGDGAEGTEPDSSEEQTEDPGQVVEPTLVGLPLLSPVSQATCDVAVPTLGEDALYQVGGVQQVIVIGDIVADNTVTVKVVFADGFAWNGDDSTGWWLDADGVSAVTTVTFDAAPADDICNPIVEETEEATEEAAQATATEEVVKDEAVEGPASTPEASSDRIAPMAIVTPGVTDVTVTPAVLPETCGTVEVNGTWAVGENSRVNDTFTLEFDARLGIAGGVRDLYAPDGTLLVAKMSVTGNVATFIMQVDGATSGTFWMESSSCWGEDYAGEDVVLPFTASSGTTWTHTVTVPEPPDPPATGKPVKDGEWTDANDQGRTNTAGAIKWTVLFPAGSSGGARIEDAAQQGWQFDLDSFQAINTGAGVAYLDPASTSSNIIVRVDGYVAETNQPGFTIEASLVAPYPEADGDGNITFNNTATAYNLNLEGDPVDPESDDASVTQTAPPPPIEPGVNPTKTGKFTRGDEGRVLPDGAIEWTIKFPVGSSNGATITDTAMPGWQFDCSSFVPVAAGGVTPVMAEGDCTPTSITVTVGAYAIRDNAPSFQIKANITDPQAESFNNCVDSVNTVADGQPINGSACLENPLTRQNLPGDGELSKSGEIITVEGETRIKWTVTFPTGAWDSGEITDLALDGWTFDTGSFAPINTGQSTAVLDPSSTSTSIQVTVGPYVAPSNPPGFTIEAVLNEDTGTWPTAQEDGSVIFENSATATMVNYGGDGTTVKTDDADVTLPPPPGPPEPGTNPSKTGEWTNPGDQGAIDPSGAIRWTVTLPHGPANGAVITDYARDGWVFDCDSLSSGTIVFEGEEISIDVDCDPALLVVTVGPYGGDENSAPQFTIDASITLTPSHQNGRGFNNTVVSEVTDITGTVTKTGSITTDWLVQESDFGGDGRPYSIPMDPIVRGAVCENGIDPDPTLEMPADGFGLTYEVINDLDPVTGDYSVKATKAETHQWGFLPEGWEIDPENEAVATYNGHVDIVPCQIVELVLPVVDAAVCVGGVEPDPTSKEIVLGESNEIVSYEITSPINAAGEYQVTATKDANAHWPEDLGDWELVDGEPNQVVYSGQVEIVPCTPTTPHELPEIAGNVCVGGEYSGPSASFANTNTITYTDVVVSEIVDGKFTITATATLAEGFAWDANMPDGWTVSEENPSIATYSGTFNANECESITPQELPEIVGNVCEGGEYTDPSATYTDTEVITYTNVVVSEIADGTFTITATATLADGFAWTVNMPDGWTVSEEDPSVATYNGTFDWNPCVPVAPVLPEIAGNVCEGGAYTPPTVTFGEPNEDIEYSNGVAAGGQITADAQLTRDGLAWGNLEGTGWTVDPADPTRASYLGSYTPAPCAPIVPGIPVVQEAVCLGGELINPVVTIVDTELITYAKSGEEVPGGTVIITATLVDGYEWDAELPAGWTMNSENPAEATYVVELADVNCTPIVPVTPDVTPAVCEGGKVVNPSVELPTNPGITYTKSGEEVPGGTVVITATLEDGYEWGELPEGWTKVSTTEATFEIALDGNPCEPVVPEVPTVNPAVCEEGKVVDPGVTLPTTPGITYTMEGEVKAGGKVTITATLENGYEWGEMPEGWTLVDVTTATFEITFDGISCEKPVDAENPDDPTDPKDPPAVNKLPETGTGVDHSGLGVALTSMAGLMLAAIALRMNAYKRS